MQPAHGGSASLVALVDLTTASLRAQNDKLRGRAAYFVRISQKAVTDKTVEQDIAAGQISGTALDSFRTLLIDLFVPVLKEQGNWGKSAEEYVTEFMQARHHIAETWKEGNCVAVLRARSH